MSEPRPLGLPHVARILTRTALKLRFGERLVIVQDAGSDAVATAIAEAADEAGVWVKRARLDELRSGTHASPRPHKVIPDSLALGLKQAHASVFVAAALHQEQPMRQALLHLARDHRLRHAHLPGITPHAFVAGMQLDCEVVARIGHDVLRKLERARGLLVESAGGTFLRIDLAAENRWFAQLGVLEPGSWGNFPAGALYTSPHAVSGVFVADASLGEFFGARAGLLSGKSVALLIEDGRVVGVECPDEGLRRDLEAMLAFSSNSNRVGLVSVGVNLGIDAPIGDASVDQNLPGLHLGIGDPAGRATGAAWSAPTCFAACEAASRVLADGQLIIDGGKLAAPRDGATPLRRDSGVRAV